MDHSRSGMRPYAPLRKGSSQIKRVRKSACAILMAVGLAAAAFAQPAAQITTAVPRLIKFSGTLTDGGGKPISGVVGLTFALYQEREGGAPIWMETQNVQAAANGDYEALLGASRNDGIPPEVFGAGERWLGVQEQGEAERPRVLMTSVPYSLKAVDSETLGGLPASAFALAGTSGSAAGGGSIASGRAAVASGSAKPAATPAAVTGAGTAGTIPLWTGSTALGNSVLTQASGSLGIGALLPGYAFTVAVTSGDAIAGSTSASGKSGVYGEADQGVGVAGIATASTGKSEGVLGEAGSPEGFGVWGDNESPSGEAVGVYGSSSSSSGYGVFGYAIYTSGTTIGVYGLDGSNGGIGVEGQASASSGSTIGVYGKTISDAGIGVEGKATSTTGSTVGVQGQSASDAGAGLAGLATATSGSTQGVYGDTSSPSGAGVFGVAVAESSLGQSIATLPAGVWGDVHDEGAAVLATADDAYAIAAYNKATNVPALYVENQEDNQDVATVMATNSAYGGYCDIFVSGDLICSGSVGGGALIPDGPNGARNVALYSVQAADNWMEDAGSGQLRNGSAVVTLDGDYAETVNTGMEYHVFLTPKGDCKGLYVSNEGSAGFEVHELGRGSSNIGFDYRIMARRKGFEKTRLADMTGKIYRGPVSTPGDRARPARRLPSPRAAAPAAEAPRPSPRNPGDPVNPVRKTANVR